MNALLPAVGVAAFAAAAASAAPFLIPIPRPDSRYGATPTCISGDARVVYANTPGNPVVWISGLGPSYLTTPGISRTAVTACSRDATIAAGVTEVTGIDQVPVLWVNRVPTILDSQQLVGAVNALSADGHVAVGYTLKYPQTYRAVTWTDGGPLVNLDPGTVWTSSTALDVSADGTRIVGYFTTPDTGSDRHLVLFTDGVPREIEAPTDWSEWPPVPYQVHLPQFITDDGTAIIGQLMSHGFNRIFRYGIATQEWTDIGDPAGSNWSMILGTINRDGTSIAGFVQAHQDFIAYNWTSTSGWYDLRQYLIDNGLPALGDPIVVTGIADDGLSMCLYALDPVAEQAAGYLLTMEFPPCEGDFNRDGQADVFDYLDFVAAYDAQSPSADFNRDAQIDFFDYLDFVAALDAGCD